MSNLKLLYKLLRLKGMKITDFWFANRGKELHLAVKPYKNGCRCPQCGRRGRIEHRTTRPESIAETQNHRFIDRGENRHYRLLDNLVFQRGDAELSLSAIRFGMHFRRDGCARYAPGWIRR
jgi:transposase